MGNILPTLLKEVRGVTSPLLTAFSSERAFKLFMLKFGWEFPSLPVEYSEIATRTDGLFSKIDSLSDGLSIDELKGLLEDFKVLYESLSDLTSLTSPDTSDYNDILSADFFLDSAKEIIDFLICNAVHNKSQLMFNFLHLIGVFKEEDVNAIGVRKAYHRFRIDFGALKTALSSPEDIMSNEYDWGDDDFEFNEFVTTLGNVLFFLGLGVQSRDFDQYQVLNLDESSGEPEVRTGVDISLISTIAMGAWIKAGVSIVQADSETEKGVAIVPFMEGTTSTSVDIGNDYILTLMAAFDVDLGVMLKFLPDHAPVLSTGLFSSISNASVDGELIFQLVSVPNEPGDRNLVLGSLEATYMAYESLDFSFGMKKENSSTELSLEAELTGGIIHIDGGDGDGFLSRILPEGGLDVDFDLLVGFSTLKGFYFSGSASLEVEIPIKKKIGNDDAAINFDSVTLSIGADESGQIKSYAATSFSLILGPLTASIDKIGMRADLDFPGSGGNLGPLDADIDFKFPSGVGITVDSDSFTGGGFLNFDKDKGRYVGGLELSFSKFSLAAVGIITTKLPDGEEGYSLLLVITAEFNPVQIGLGFTLNGVGGLLALHRTMKVDELRKGIKENTLESILFPKEIVKNASRIISDMERVFPIKKDRFVFGPMGKIGWGTPTLVTIDLGLMIEVPKPVTIAVLGILRAQVPPPGEDNEVIDPMLVLQINFLGVIEFEKKEISFDASLFDSKIQDFPLEGDMALRIKWGETPNFLMSIGGFNNSFVPPPLNLPELRRLSVNFSKGSDAAGAEVLAETYFAITSNTLQFGADIYAKLEVEVFKAEGAIGFHALFQFDPFQLQANAYAWFSLAWGGKDVATVSAELSIKGPGRWKVNGSGEIYTPIWSGSGSFEAEFGKEDEQKAIEPTATWPILEKALAHKDNWVLDQPKYRQVSVAIKEVDAETENPDEEIRIHPFGQLKFIQSQMPLNFKMKQYGNSGISDYDKFWIDSVTDDGTALEYETVEDFFAPAQFTHLSDDDKLSSPSFEKFEGGLSIGTQKLAGGTSVTKTLGYEPASIDRRKRVADSDSVVKVDTIRFTKMNDFAVQVGKKNPRRTPDLAHDGQASTRTKQGGYVAAKKADSSQHGSSSFATYEDARAYVQSEMATNPSLENQLFIAEAQEILELV